MTSPYIQNWCLQYDLAFLIINLSSLLRTLYAYDLPIDQQMPICRRWQNHWSWKGSVNISSPLVQGNGVIWKYSNWKTESTELREKTKSFTFNSYLLDISQECCIRTNFSSHNQRSTCLSVGNAFLKKCPWSSFSVGDRQKEERKFGNDFPPRPALSISVDTVTPNIYICQIFPFTSCIQ